ncbi:polyketide cyclase [Leptobacterium flavescens]|uniref:Polyketide cyclase n=1 Tax=Leptobacterium flavescens TaxID=472055 RepID=A0A6P0ULN5_9FLAO|nr:SRPBCC family protein [Leptobacterium flavescens]NER11963.1 polyketide cyclase [Leptobacterium flavescens]
MATVLYILGAIVLLIVVLALLAPSKYDVNRSIEINKPVGEVFDYLKFVKNQDEWSPWKKKDPNMKQTHSGTDGKAGFTVKWEGNKDVGVGEQEIKKITKNKSIETELRFYKPFKSQSDAYLNVEKLADDKTKVIWGFTGTNKFPMSIFMLFMNMDKAVGKDFEQGLADLKSILEK